MAGLAERCAAWPLATSLLVGCSLGRGAADALSDIDAALGVDAPRGEAGAARVETVEAMVAAALPELGALVDVLRHRTGPAGQHGRRIFAQFADGAPSSTWRSWPRPRSTIAAAAAAPRTSCRSIRHPPRGTPQHLTPAAPVAPPNRRPRTRSLASRSGSGPSLGWCALIDTDKYLRRGSLWEADTRLHEARHQIWALWAAAHGALYPWHGLSQVLDHDPWEPAAWDRVHRGRSLDPADLRRAARASAGVLVTASEAAARRHPADLPTAMAAYVTRALRPEP